MKQEVRYTTAKTELRSGIDGKSIQGYAAVFDLLSGDLGGFQERIIPGAFRRAINEKQDVRALLNHDASLILGRTSAGTLELEEDNKGLYFDCALPDTSYARDLLTSIKRGDISQCSFGFRMRKQRWLEDNGRNIRELLDVDLFDVSPVTYPAYADTEVVARQLRSAGSEIESVGLYRDLTDEEWADWARRRVQIALLQ